MILQTETFEKRWRHFSSIAFVWTKGKNAKTEIRFKRKQVKTIQKRFYGLKMVTIWANKDEATAAL